MCLLSLLVKKKSQRILFTGEFGPYFSQQRDLVQNALKLCKLCPAPRMSDPIRWPGGLSFQIPLSSTTQWPPSGLPARGHHARQTSPPCHPQQADQLQTGL